MYKCKAPVAIVIFKRTENVEKLLECLKTVELEKLYIIADGGRDEAEWAKVTQCRKMVEDAYKDKSIVHTIYSDNNLGCDTRIITGLNELFIKEERAIILEDDCMPSEDFFKFCDDMLEKYADNDEISHIVGSKIVSNDCQSSYFFSYMGVTWGWATWTRAWEKFRRAESYIESREIDAYYETTKEIKGEAYQKSLKEQIDIYRTTKGEVPWDYSWFLTNHGNRKLCIVPNANLVLNIGFEAEGATHTSEIPEYYKGVKITKLVYPLEEPEEVKANKDYDMLLFKAMNYKDPFRFFKPSYYIKRFAKR